MHTETTKKRDLGRLSRFLAILDGLFKFVNAALLSWLPFVDSMFLLVYSYQYCCAVASDQPLLGTEHNEGL